MTNGTCGTCGHIHSADDARAVGRFRSDGPIGYRAKSGGPVRATRPQAEADECATRLQEVPHR